MNNIGNRYLQAINLKEMSLVSPEELINMLNKNGLGLVAKPLTHKLMQVLHLNELNALYEKFKHLQAKEFIDAVLSDLNISYEVSFDSKSEVSNLGQCIYIANHPLGGIDGLILLRILLESKENINILTNFLLSRIEPLTPYFFYVNPFENKKVAFSSSKGIRNAFLHLKNNGSLAIFPAGQVSAFTLNNGIKIQDKQWEIPTIKFIKKVELPVVPIYFHAKNSPTFYALSTLHSSLRTAALPGEIFKARDSRVLVTVGKPINKEEIQNSQNIYQLRELLRSKTYSLGDSLKNKKLKKNHTKIFAKSIILQKNLKKNKILHCINRLELSGLLLLQSGEYKVFCARLGKQNPVMLEIGRLREITFQSIGEGTNKLLDIDKYDGYYHQLILWHIPTQSIAGAYRLGIGKEIWKTYGINGFYLSSLYEFYEPAQILLKNGIELGRAFVTSEFQAKPLPLLLMWKGIMTFIKKNNDIKFIVGAVSISNEFKSESKKLIIDYLNEFHLDEELSPYVTAHFPYNNNSKNKNTTHIKSISQLENYVKIIENEKKRMPILIKKYVMINAKFIGFNVDPSFNNSIDGLMYVPYSKIDNPILYR